MTEPNGQEYILDANPNRTTSIIIRKSPNIVTLMQRTVGGLAVIDLTEEVRQAMIDLLAPPPQKVAINWDSEATELVALAPRASWEGLASEFVTDDQFIPGHPHEAANSEPPKRRGRPPKAA